MIKGYINFSQLNIALPAQIYSSWHLISYYNISNPLVFYPENTSNYYMGITLAVIGLILSFFGVIRSLAHSKTGRIKPSLKVKFMKIHIALPISCMIMSGVLLGALYFQGIKFYDTM